MFALHRFCCLLGAASILGPLSSLAADRGLAVETARLARENLRDSRQKGGPKAMVAVAQPEVSLTIGLAYDEDESNTRITNTPFEFSWKGTGENWWAFKINSDGYGTIDPDGGSSTSGLLNAKLSAWYKLNPNFIGSVSLSVPTHGDIGSQDYGQGAKLIFSKDLTSDWSIKGLLSLSHTNATQQPGVSQTSQGLLGSFTYDLKDNRSIALSLVRSFQNGTSSTTDFSVEYDYSIPKSKVDLALSLTRGLTNGARHTGVEFDVTFNF